MSASREQPRNSNRLAAESSPYLLQHAYNPIDWYPWGPDAFEKARREEKPIFVSIGYSTCYWCHVMERQSFENDAVAAVMNSHFVNIKVDREERPDVDQLYMTAVQVQTHHGGWPMSVFLTPDLEYFYGGTYFPPEDAYGRPGFVTLLNAIHEAWTSRREQVIQSAKQFTEILQKLSGPAKPQSVIEIDAKFIAHLIDRSIADFDPTHGGYGGAPKFPRQTLLELLLHANSDDSPIASSLATRNSQLATSLDAMMHGGIRDQLGGGFHRYSTDAQWLVPHFEIMLYDNAMLGWIYAEAAERFGDQRYATVARELFDFILREMTSPEGAFCTAIDAEVDAQEGRPYLWTAVEIRAVLQSAPRGGAGAPFSDADVDLFLKVFGVARGPNFADPHHGNGVAQENILFIAEPELHETHRERLAGMRRTLLEARAKRKQPLRDTKIITSWNALMIRAMAHAGAALDEPTYQSAAERAARFLLHHHRRGDGAVLRTSRGGSAKYDGGIDDYAFLADACLSLHDVTGAPEWLDSARSIATQMLSRFEDSSNGGFFFTDACADDLIVRQKSAADSPLPAGNAVAARVLLRLGYVDSARRAVAAFAGQILQHGEAMSAMVQSALELLRAGVRLSAAPGDARTLESPDRIARGVVRARAVQPSAEDIRVMLNIEAGWHIHANPAGAGMDATSVHPPPGAEATIEYPAGRPLRAAFADRPIPIYDGEVIIRMKLKHPADLVGREISVVYQACNDDSCLMPARTAVLVEAG